MTVAPTALFTGSVRACWITTYNLDLGLFDSFLLPRLGEPPVNAVVLADQDKVDEALQAVPVDESWRLERTNRRWLLRPIATGGAFHPKSLLMVMRDRATLLVGSGNLSLSGLDTGHETFTTFTSDTPWGRAALTTWVDWTRRVVTSADDALVTQRFDHLLQTLPTLTSDISDPPLLHNLKTPLVDQLVARLPSTPPAVLHLAAPFHDPNGAAVSRLLEDLRPAKIVVYVARDHQVDGPALRHTLDRASGSVEVRRFIDPEGDPIGFVHAKLLGVSYDDGRGFLVGGSANLSAAALLLSPADNTHANLELATITRVDAVDVEAAFRDEDRLTTEPIDMAELDTWTADYEDQPTAPLYRIYSAIRTEAGTIDLRVEPNIGPDARLTDGTDAGPVTDFFPTRPMIWLLDDGDEPISNRAVIAVPSDLESQLGERTGSSGDVPEGLRLDDLDSPIGHVLAFLHRNAIMDVSETDAIKIADRGTEGSVDDGDSLWERLATEKLRRDPRASAYANILARSSAAPDDLTALLASLLKRAPEQTRNTFANVLGFPLPTEPAPRNDGEDTEPISWSTTARVRVRLRNVLKRWIRGLGDERLVWVDPNAPLVNLRLLTDTLLVMAAFDLDTGLTREEILDLAHDLTDAAISVLAPAANDIPDALLDRTPQLLAAGALLATGSGTDRRTRTLQWQRTLRRSAWLVTPGPITAEIMSAITGRAVDEEQAAAALHEVIIFIDDKEWTRRTRETLELADLAFGDHTAFAGVDVLVRVDGIAEPLTDLRTIPLVLELREYRNADTIVVEHRDQRWRVNFLAADHVCVRDDTSVKFRESEEILDWETIEALDKANATLASLFPATLRVA